MLYHSCTCCVLLWDVCLIKGLRCNLVIETHSMFCGSMWYDIKFSSYLPRIYRMVDRVVSLSQVDVEFWKNYAPTYFIPILLFLATIVWMSTLFFVLGVPIQVYVIPVSILASTFLTAWIGKLDVRREGIYILISVTCIVFICAVVSVKPIIDIVILAAGFVIRIFYGGMITGVSISKWLYLVITSGSLYMGLGKRRNEMKKQTDTRDVLKYYNVDFLDKNMYVCVALTIVFYALWTYEMPNAQISWTIPIFIILLMSYSLDVEGDSDGDPVEVILHDKILMGILILYALFIFGLLYAV